MGQELGHRAGIARISVSAPVVQRQIVAYSRRMLAAPTDPAAHQSSLADLAGEAAHLAQLAEIAARHGIDEDVRRHLDALHELLNGHRHPRLRRVR